MKIKNPASLSVLEAGSSPFDVPGCPLPSLFWPAEPLLAISEGLGVPQRGGHGGRQPKANSQAVLTALSLSCPFS